MGQQNFRIILPLQAIQKSQNFQTQGKDDNLLFKFALQIPELLTNLIIFSLWKVRLWYNIHDQATLNHMTKYLCGHYDLADFLSEIFKDKSLFYYIKKRKHLSLIFKECFLNYLGYCRPKGRTISRWMNGEHAYKLLR
jgi:hypothetical protein